MVRFDQKFIRVIWGSVKEREFPLYPDEIEKVNVKGQQLLFSFMEGELK